jgi:hypothetical protein
MYLLHEGFDLTSVTFARLEGDGKAIMNKNKAIPVTALGAYRVMRC